MSLRADVYRQKAAEAKQSAAQAKNPSIKSAFEEVARGWLLLAEQVEWMDSPKSIHSSNGQIIGSVHQTRACCGIAVDVGANVGFFAYALADIADRVLAFEPNPDYAFFARWMLRDRAEVHEVALSDASAVGPYTSRFRTRGCSSTWPAA